MLLASAVTAGLGAPPTVVQVLTVEVLTDGLPALALARDPASPETMAVGPRRGALLPSPLRFALVLEGAKAGSGGTPAGDTA